MSNTKRSHEEETHLRVPQNEDDDYNDLPPPPDGGYGWVIVAASFMCNMVVDGISYTFGIFLTEIVKDYGETKGNVAWVGSILTGMTMCAGPIVSALANKFGCRTVCIVGSLISTAAFALSIFSPNVVWLMLTYGFVGGTGFGLIYLPAVVCVGYYFESKRSLATGIAVCGSGVGTFAFAPLATILLQIYGWKGANLILAGMILNCVIFGALMRPLEYPAPPDGGYGWVIVAASFVCNMVVDGIAYTFGMFLFEIINYYNESKGKTAWVGSILTGTYLIIGPLVSALCNKFGCRAVCIAGSIISTVAFALSIFSPTVNWLMFTYGFLGGFGFGLIYLPAVVCVGYYFESKRSLATGIAVCGSGAGTFAFAPLATILLDRYGWKGANLILAVTAGFISLSSIILVDLVGLDKLTNAFGLLTFYRGAAALIGTPLAGTLYDMTQSYELPFFVAASLFGLAAITSFTAPLLKRTSNKNIETNDVLKPINEENEV